MDTSFPFGYHDIGPTLPGYQTYFNQLHVKQRSQSLPISYPGQQT